MLEAAPGLILATCVGVGGFGSLFCEPPTLGLKSFKRSTSETEFLLILSILTVVVVGVYGASRAEEWAIIGFGIEIGVCCFELIYLRNRMSVDTLVHHICTPVAIVGSLSLPSVGVAMLAYLCGSLSVGNAIILTSKLMATSSTKRRGLLLSFLAGLVLRVVIPILIVLSLIVDIVSDASRPEWTRLYVTAMLMLLFLNVQLVVALYLRLVSE